MGFRFQRRISALSRTRPVWLTLRLGTGGAIPDAERKMTIVILPEAQSDWCPAASLLISPAASPPSAKARTQIDKALPPAPPPWRISSFSCAVAMT